MRADVLAAGILSELNETVTQAKSKFSRWMNKNESVPTDLREVVYAAGIKYGALTEWQHCWNMYKSTENSSERKMFLKALGGASDPWLLQR